MSTLSKIFFLIILWFLLAIFCIYNELNKQFETESSALNDKITSVITSIKTNPFKDYFDFSSTPSNPEENKEETVSKIPLAVINKEVKEAITISETLEENTAKEEPLKEENKVEENKVEEKKNDSALEKKEDLKQKQENLLETKPLEKTKLEVKEETKAVTLDLDSVQEEINLLVSKNQIIFKRLSSDVTAKSKKTIKAIAVLLNKYKSINIEVAGHTDAKGEKKFNQKISEKRALSVRKQLITYGLHKKRVRAKGYGESQPIVKNDGNGYSVVNRRVEFNIIKE